MKKEEVFRSGFISIIGRPNVGKSTLLNRILSEKVAIVSDKPQTTRHRIIGIKNLDNAQLIFIDTPGIHKARSNLNRHMVNVSFKAFRDSDLILFLTDEREDIGKGDRYIISNILSLKGRESPCFLLINKIDLLKPEQLLSLIDLYSQDFTFSEIIPISAITGEGIDILLKMILQYLPEGPRYFHEDMVTDQPERVLIAELIREKVIDSTREEIPYSATVVVEDIRESRGDTVVVDAVIYVEKESQKGIIIGKGGEMLKRIGKRGREEIERRIKSKVYLNLWVKVKRDWRKDNKALKELGII